MYTFNNFIYGHNCNPLSYDEEPKINIALTSSCILEWLEGRTTIDGINFDIDSPYHGGSHYTPIIFGVDIACDDDNPEWLEVVRNANESDYSDTYNKFLVIFFKKLNDLELKFESDGHLDEETKEQFEYVRKYFIRTEPGFYLCEASS